MKKVFTQCLCLPQKKEIKMVTQYSGNIFGSAHTGNIFVISGKTTDRAARYIIILFFVYNLH